MQYAVVVERNTLNQIGEPKMGFWGTLGKAASAVGNAAKDHFEKVNSLAEDYEHESDDYVKRKFQNGSATEKMAAAKVLKARGYSKDTL